METARWNGRSGHLGMCASIKETAILKRMVVRKTVCCAGAASAGRHVLAIQDTAEMKFPTPAQRRRGLGPIKSGNAYGVLVHAMIAVDADSQACLGLVGGEVWNRPGVVTTAHRDRPLSERESRRWLETAEQAKAVLLPAAVITVVDDREGDIYAKWASLPQPGFHLLTRAMVDRPLGGKPTKGKRPAPCLPRPGAFPRRTPGRSSLRRANRNLRNEPPRWTYDLAKCSSAVRVMSEIAVWHRRCGCDWLKCGKLPLQEEQSGRTGAC